MIHTLPGNRLEHLVDPLAQLLAMPVADPLQRDRIIVQHPGMARWLHMRLAEHPQRRVAMNLEYPLPANEMWALIRAVLGDERVPQRSPYQREILAWRLYELLGRDAVRQRPELAEPTRYWREQSRRQQPLRRFQLAEELADLYEQYQLYRPDWILAWDRGEGDSWQGVLWRMLTAEQPDHPLRLLEAARERLSSPAQPLPERLFVFGINALAPLWLDFMSEASQRGGVDFHILYLNPSDEYWGDLVSEKQEARQRARWLAGGGTDDGDALHLDAGNPLLSGLGHQGQQFVRLLSERADLETPLYLEPDGESLLAQLQRDVLHLRDGRQAPSEHCDDTVRVVSAHSALREVQALHDWLLHRFNEDATLTPRDVVVMCPNVEQYAPFVEAVFAGRDEALAETAPPLPSAIADRDPGAADPATAAFLELLSLPDARFQVSQVMSWLQVPAIRARFGLDPDAVAQVTEWLRAACIHWGLDAEHKAQWVGTGASGQHSWDQGLERLLLGFAWGDDEAIVGDRLLLPRVEGDDAVALGRLIELLRTLKALRAAMQQPRTIPEWQAFLHERLRSAVFQTGGEHEAVQEDLREVIRELGEHAGQAGFEEAVPLPVVRHVLERSLQAPGRTGRSFLTGQVTVCSMVPMRSIPFRIVAVLGLNDGDFPRQRPPLGFDLMADDPPRPGDRSRRGDDNYLFLEALLSARDRLYLSFQGRDVRTNAERQPSLVLAELMSYLEGATGWRREADLRQLPLQPFERDNYRGAEPSFDPGWLRLAEPGEAPARRVELPPPERPEVLTLEALLTVLAQPAKAFARQRLGLHLEAADEPELVDEEPFGTDHLMRHQLQTRMVERRLAAEPVEPVVERARLSGELPEHAQAEQELEAWREQAEAFAEALQAEGAARVATVAIDADLAELRVTGELPVRPDGRQLWWRLANPKGKDYLRLWLGHLLVNVQGGTETLGLYRGGEGELTRLCLAPLDPEDAREGLERLVGQWRLALCQPSALHADLLGALARVPDRQDQGQVRKALREAWEGNPHAGWTGVGQDPYMAWLWGGELSLDAAAEELEAVYGDLLAAIHEAAEGDDA